MRRLTLARLQAIIERARAAGLRLPAQLPLVVIKEVDDSHAADVVMSLFPRSRMLFLVRDGRDVLDSLLDANRPTGWLTKAGWGSGEFDNVRERRAWIREHCRNWVARMNVCLAECFEAHDAALRRRVCYEDVIADTRVTDRMSARWLELPATSEEIRRIAAAHSFAALPDYAKGPGMFRRCPSPGSMARGTG